MPIEATTNAGDGSSGEPRRAEIDASSGDDRWLRTYLGVRSREAGQYEPDPAPRGDAEPEPGQPLPERVVSDPETLRAISDPLRLRILETMVTRADGAWSVKELAATLDVPQTRLYHHVELLVDRDLIRPAGQRLVSGIVETRYRVAALSLRLDPRLLASEEASTDALVANVIDAARGELIAALRSTPIDPDGLPAGRPLVTRGVAKLTPERAGELRARLVALLEEFDDGEQPGALPYGLLLAFYPSPRAGKPRAPK